VVRPEPYTWAFAVLAVASLGRGRPGWAGVFLALCLAMKETALLLVVPVLAGALALQGLRPALVAALGPLAFGLAFVARNLALGSGPPATFVPFRVGDPAAGARGLLSDPAYGLLWFAPLLAVAMVGWALPPRDRRQGWLAACSFAVFAGYSALTACWVDPRGGSTYATRLLLPALPALAVPLARLAEALPRGWAASVLGGLGAVGFAVAGAAAADPVAAFWSAPAARVIAGQPVASGAALVLAAVALGALWRHGVAPPAGRSAAPSPGEGSPGSGRSPTAPGGT
jgi:hypothetical protein